ncbi:hypothetical protein P7C73_g3159, partial [Tremellales sp. Uapishka_1]
MQVDPDDFAHSHTPSMDPHDSSHDEEAALEVLRAALSGDSTHLAPSPSSQVHMADIDPALQPQPEAQRTALHEAEKALNQLVMHSNTNMTILDNLKLPAAFDGLTSSLEALVNSNRRQVGIVRDLIASLAQAGIGSTILLATPSGYVTRERYNELQARYDALSGRPEPSRKRGTNTRQSTSGIEVETAGDGERFDPPIVTTASEDKSRKKRSMKLEHLVHQKANRRLGVEYLVSGFEVQGSKDLPAPESKAPHILQSVNCCEEYRPNFQGDINAPTVRPFIDRVVEDCIYEWEEKGMGAGEEDIGRDQIERAVHVYWTRLGKRYDEQLTRERGEVHRDELTRRKQNQYRRQQSLLARRSVAFEQSPLNACKLRALYRTLLTIDFTAPTNEKPDPKRTYTYEEWEAYRRLSNGGKPTEAHEIIDQFWLSDTARSLLTILDISANDQNSRLKRKGRPKQPSPTFHLPSALWDRTTMPVIRPKDSEGLPISGANGIILYRFHVDEQVQAEFPDWAKGLYDNPPLSEDDALLPSLPEVMNLDQYALLKPRIKAAREAASPRTLTPEQVQNSHVPEGEQPQPPPPQPQPQQPEMDPVTVDFMSRNLDSFVALASNPFLALTSPGAFTLQGMGDQETTAGGPAAGGPSLGSSVRARKLAKRMASELPGGAATPVPKRSRLGEQVEVDVDLKDDAGFLEGL